MELANVVITKTHLLALASKSQCVGFSVMSGESSTLHFSVIFPDHMLPLTLNVFCSLRKQPIFTVYNFLRTRLCTTKTPKTPCQMLQLFQKYDTNKQTRLQSLFSVSSNPLSTIRNLMFLYVHGGLPWNRVLCTLVYLRHVDHRLQYLTVL